MLFKQCIAYLEGIQYALLIIPHLEANYFIITYKHAFW
jgi:hypothetical protein